MSRATKRDEWFERLADLSSSGLSQKEWCAQNGVPLHQLGYWRRRLQQEGTSESDTGGAGEWFGLRLFPEEKVEFSGLRVEVGPACVTIQTGFDVALLRAVVQALAGLEALPKVSRR